MHLEQVKTRPDPYEPYLLSQAIRVGPWLFVSGQAAVGEDGAIVGVGDFARQAEQAFKNLDRALRAGGSSLQRVAKVTIYLTDMNHFPQVVEQRRRWFSKPYPADTIVQVASLYAPEAMIEIEAIALADEERR